MQTIDLRTAQNVTVEYELASLRDRFIAAFTDFLISIIAYYILFFLVINALQDSFYESQMFYQIMVGAMPIFCFMLYQWIFEVATSGQSIGKRMMKIQVVRVDGEPVSFGDSLLRALFMLIDAFLSFGIIGGLSIVSSNTNQRLGDLAAGTTAIRLKSNVIFTLKDILSIDSIEDYEPQYPDVRQLTEEDMLLIKNVITRYRKHRNIAHSEAVDLLANRLTTILDLPTVPKDKIEFFKTLIRDYIVLTR